jgi:hypothetical protein
MTAAPIDIPLDERGAPDLNALVRKLGQAAAAARGEVYDPANKPEHGGYRYITLAIWKAFDEAMAAHQQTRRTGETPGPASNTAEDATPPTFGPLDYQWPHAQCESCSAEARFGYRNNDGTMRWFCAAHRLAKNWADARR